MHPIYFDSDSDAEQEYFEYPPEYEYFSAEEEDSEDDEDIE